MAEEIKKGTVVQLKSGGAKMSVSNSNAGKTTCIWFDSNNKLHKAVIPTALLDIL